MKNFVVLLIAGLSLVILERQALAQAQVMPNGMGG